MPSLHAPLRALLESWSQVTDLLTVNPTSNDLPIRPERLFQTDKLPGIEISQPKEVFDDDLDGDQSRSVSDVIISVISTNFDEVNALADAISKRKAPDNVGERPTGLGGYSGPAGNLFLQGVSIKEIHRGVAPQPDGSDSAEYVASIICEISARVPTV